MRGARNGNGETWEAVTESTRDTWQLFASTCDATAEREKVHAHVAGTAVGANLRPYLRESREVGFFRFAGKTDEIEGKIRQNSLELRQLRRTETPLTITTQLPGYRRLDRNTTLRHHERAEGRTSFGAWVAIHVP